MVVGYEREEGMRDGEKDGWDESWMKSGDVTQIKESLAGKYRGVVEKKFRLEWDTTLI